MLPQPELSPKRRASPDNSQAAFRLSLQPPARGIRGLDVCFLDFGRWRDACWPIGFPGGAPRDRRAIFRKPRRYSARSAARLSASQLALLLEGMP